MSPDLSPRETSPLLECGMLWATKKGDYTKVAELLSSGVCCNVQDSEGFTPLHYAAQECDLKLVDMLIQGGAHCDIRTRDTLYSPLHCMSLYKYRPDRLAIIQALVAGGCGLNHQDYCKKTALHYLSLTGTPESIAYLIEAGADLDVQDDTGWTALHLACYEHMPGAVEVLLKAGARTDLKENDSWTVLHWAAYQGSGEIVKLLLDSGADPNIKDNEGFTALYTASIADHAAKTVEVFKLLLEAGGDVNNAGSIGWTPLHRAANNETADVVKLLLENGAKTDLQNISGDTALHIATGAGVVQTVEVLIDYGASLSIQDLEWKTPFQKAVERMDPSIVKPFLGAGALAKLKLKDNEDTVMKVIAMQNRQGYQWSAERLKAVEMLYLLYEAGILTFMVTQRLLQLFKYSAPVRSLRGHSRVCIQRCIREHSSGSVSQLGLPGLLQDYILFKC